MAISFLIIPSHRRVASPLKCQIISRDPFHHFEKLRLNIFEIITAQTDFKDSMPNFPAIIVPTVGLVLLSLEPMYIIHPKNYADPVYGVATICHQVRCLRWGQPSLFHTAMSLLIWYKMFCMRDISYRLIWMKYINMLSVYAQSGTHRPVNWWIIAVLT